MVTGGLAHASVGLCQHLLQWPISVFGEHFNQLERPLAAVAILGLVSTIAVDSGVSYDAVSVNISVRQNLYNVSCDQCVDLGNTPSRKREPGRVSLPKDTNDTDSRERQHILTSFGAETALGDTLELTETTLSEGMISSPPRQQSKKNSFGRPFRPATKDSICLSVSHAIAMLESVRRH